MSKNAYQFLFGEETLYRVPEPEPVVDVAGPPVVRQPELVVETVADPAPVVSTPAETPVDRPPLVVEPVPPLSAARPEPVPEPPKPVIPQINQKVLLLFDDELTPSELILLENILKAVNLNMDGVDVLNLAGSGLVNVRPVLASKRVHHFISFGVPFTKLNLNIALNRYEIRNLAGINFMLSDPLSAIEADRALKKQLWLTLQSIFLNV
ncbi:hypothetical protein [Tellurirhabdus rosea]|uniref:hypothetical protein n=1 Tax=Tellurirhabdus rosea TaxID=2674997 RepID=UPI0022599958|nr:hypothetical protein [Tellurirhabdus rosea]